MCEVISYSGGSGLSITSMLKWNRSDANINFIFLHGIGGNSNASLVAYHFVETQKNSRPDQNRKPHLKSLWQSVWEEITNKGHMSAQKIYDLCKCFNAYKHFSSQKALLSLLVYGPCYCCEKFWNVYTLNRQILADD